MSSSLSRFYSSTVVNEGKSNRSKSADKTKRSKESRRVPVIDITDDRDVSEMVCIELSKAILLNSTINTGTFVETARVARRDISLSDTAMIISIAMLEHLGNNVMATKLLKKSNTIAEYYKSMNLTDKSIRTLFVTMLFAMNSNFVKMIESSIRLCMDRLTTMEVAHNRYNDNKANSAIMSLASDNTISKEEMYRLANTENDIIVSTTTRPRRLTINLSSDDSIAPSDSASMIGIRSPKYTTQYSRINEKDIINYNNRKKIGIEPPFSEVFPRTAKPVSLASNLTGNGLGFKTADRSNEYSTNKINNLLGSLTIRNFDQKTGREFYTRPKVEDFLESEEVPSEAMFFIPDMKSDLTTMQKPSYVKQYVPTESFLPNSTYNVTSSSGTKLNYKDSLEELMARNS